MLNKRLTIQSQKFSHVLYCARLEEQGRPGLKLQKRFPGLGVGRERAERITRTRFKMTCFMMFTRCVY